MLEKHSSVKIKVESADLEDKAVNQQTVDNKGENNQQSSKINSLSGPTENLKTKQKSSRTTLAAPSDILIKPEKGDEEGECDSDLDREPKSENKMAKLKKRKKKKNTVRKARQEIKEEVVGRRMASLNASAMMQVGPVVVHGIIHSPIIMIKYAIVKHHERYCTVGNFSKKGSMFFSSAHLMKFGTLDKNMPPICSLVSKSLNGHIEPFHFR